MDFSYIRVLGTVFQIGAFSSFHEPIAAEGRVKDIFLHRWQDPFRIPPIPSSTLLGRHQLRGLPGFHTGIAMVQPGATRTRSGHTGSTEIPPGSGKRGICGYLLSCNHLSFTLHGDVVFGTFRRQQEEALKHLVAALKPIHEWLQTKRTQEVRVVAEVKNSVVIAALTTLLKWPSNC